MVDSFLDYPKGFELWAGDDVDVARAFCLYHELSPEDFKIVKVEYFYVVKRK